MGSRGVDGEVASGTTYPAVGRSTRRGARDHALQSDTRQSNRTFNRGVILDLLARELSRTRREKGCTVVMLGDLDHFKKVNDGYGHVVGDEVLQEIARRLLASVRSYDFVGRYGGEEFLIVLNNCDSSHAIARAEEVRNGIANHQVQTMRGLLPVTMSLGVFASRDWDLRLVEEILVETDLALYKAKADGRNCVRLAEPPVLCSIPLEQIP
jgi:two-component system cell cycle response regulator